MKTPAFAIFVCMFLLSACGPRGPSEEEIATQVAEQVAAELTTLALSATPTSTHRPTSTHTPTPTGTPTLGFTYAPTKTHTPTPTPGTPTATPTATPIELVSYENEELAVAFKYPSHCQQPDFSPFDPNIGEGELHIECEDGPVAFLLWWMPSSDDVTLQEEAEPHIGEEIGQVLVSHEPFSMTGESAYLTEWKWRDVHWLTVKTRYQGYFYRFNWRSESYEKVLRLFDLMLPHIRFVPTSATATPQPATPTPVPPTPTAAVSWQEVATFQGSDMTTTAPFDIQGDAWRVRWTATPRWEGDLPFDIYGVREGQQPGQDIPIVFVISSGRGGSDVSYSYTGPGRYYLVVNSAGFDWTIVVEDQY